MPTEPNPSLDEQLKAYAATRRRLAGAPFTLPPGTRQVLRAEVERQFGQAAAARRPPLGWWETFWPYVVLGGSAVVFLAVCAGVWWQDRRPPERELASVRTAAKAPPSPPAGPAKMELERAKSPAEAVRPETAAAAPTTPRAAGLAASRSAPAPAVMPAAPPPTAAAPVARPSMSEPGMPSAAAFVSLAPTAPVSQRYVQQPAGRQLRRNLNSPPMPGVLNDFRFEQSGNSVRITDADGSVYVGAIETPTAYGMAGPSSQGTPPNDLAMRAKQTTADKPMADYERKTTNWGARFGQAVVRGEQRAAGSQAGAEGGYWFNAIGTNRSLGQRVVVTGRLVATNALELMNQLTQNVAAGANVAGAVSNVQPQSLQQLLFNNFRVQGRVTVGGRTQMELNALPAGQ
jgi:hypothetical protein